MADAAATKRASTMAVVGSAIIAWSAILVALAGTAPVTAAVFRCAYAAPILGLLAWWHVRRAGASALTRRQWGFAVLAGTSFAVDLILWHIAIDAVGAGLATVLANTQVVLYPLAAWLVWSEQPRRRDLVLLPVVLLGIVGISGVVGAGTFGSAPVLGAVTGSLTGVAYTGFLLALRAGAPADGRTPVGMLAAATTVAALVAALAGLVTRSSVDLAPSWPAHGWLALLAVACQVVAWLLITGSLRQVPAARLSVLLLVQPVTALLLGVVLLGESPGPVQWLGAALLLVGIARSSASGR